MSEDNTETADEADTPRRSPRGSATRRNPFADSSPPEQATDDEPTVVIMDPDSESVREYELTETVKRSYERMFESKFEHGNCEWYDFWWDGTELVIEYSGYFRDDSLRPDYEDKSSDDIMEMMFSRASNREMDGIPRARHPVQDGHRGARRRGRSMQVDLSGEGPPHDYLDEGVLPVHNVFRFDVQDRADANPLATEDLFIRPWSDDGQEPVRTHEPTYSAEDREPIRFRDYRNLAAERANDNWNA